MLPFLLLVLKGLQTLGYHLTPTAVWRVVLVMHTYNDSSRGEVVSDLFLGIPSRSTPLRNSRWTHSITTDVFSPKAINEANLLWLKCARGAHGRSARKVSKVSNISEGFYIGYMCLALVTYKAHIAMETHVKNACSHSCPLPKLFQRHSVGTGAGCTAAALQLVVHRCSPELWLQESSVPSREKHSCFALMLDCQTHVK